METLDNRVLHLVMYLSTKSGISFQTALAFAVILAASLSNVASVCSLSHDSPIFTGLSPCNLMMSLAPNDGST